MSTSPKRDEALHLLRSAGPSGITWRDLEAIGIHPRTSSGLLSKLAEQGEAVRLRDRRDGCSVYVEPAHAEDREVVGRQYRGGANLAAAQVAAEMAEVLGEAQLAVARLEWEAERLQAEAEHIARDRMHDAARRRQRDELARLRKRVEVLEGERLDVEAQGWQIGYDEGISRGRDPQEAFAEGRALGRQEGEDLIRARVERVGVELYRAITSNAAIRPHFKGCYQIHPECVVKAMGRSAGITLKPIGWSAAS